MNSNTKRLKSQIEWPDPAPLLPGPLLQRLKEDLPLVELCQKPKGGTPMQCPLTDCPCRKALLAGASR